MTPKAEARIIAACEAMVYEAIERADDIHAVLIKIKKYVISQMDMSPEKVNDTIVVNVPQEIVKIIADGSWLQKIL